MYHDTILIAAILIAQPSAWDHSPGGAPLEHAPGGVPAVFAPGIVSGPGNEAGCAFTPDGNTLYFGRFAADRGYRLHVTRATSAGWSQAEPAEFGSDFSEVDAFITGDGGRCFFISKRPDFPGAPRSPAYRIWVTRREPGGWGTPALLGRTVNSPRRQLFPTLDSEGVLYFGSDREGGFGGTDIYRSAPSGDGFGAAENVGPNVNSPHDETDALIAPDGSFLIFTAIDRADGFGNGDLYVSFRDPSGRWLPAVNMGARVNTRHSEFCPALSPCGMYLFFTSGRSGNDDIYRLDAAVIDSCR